VSRHQRIFLDSRYIGKSPAKSNGHPCSVVGAFPLDTGRSKAQWKQISFHTMPS
jgi:hypothetical protein